MESVKGRLSTDPVVFKFEILREFTNLHEGFIRVRAILTNGHTLDLSEFIKQEAELEIVSYRYQWLDANKQHIRRWDNAPHHPKLPNFPHHVHTLEDQVVPGKPIDIFEVLDEIGKLIDS
ncbi:MAG: toxin-antitoxin system TumE family protein [Chloroflexota bacterium]